MIQIRRNTFETNSSSTHSLVLCTKEQYKNFKNGNVFYVDSGRLEEHEKWCTFEQVIELFKSKKIYSWSSVDIASELLEIKGHQDAEELENHLRDYSIYSYETYFREELEDFYEELKLPDGQVVVAFGMFGYDG